MNEQEDISSKKFPRGWVVWARLSKSCQFWPGIIVTHEDCGMNYSGPDHRWVYWFGDHRVSKVDINNIYDFEEQFDYCFNENGGQNYKTGVSEAKTVYSKHAAFKGFGWKEESCESKGVQDLPPGVVQVLDDIRTQIKDVSRNIKEMNFNSDTIDECSIKDNEMKLSDSESSVLDQKASKKVSLKEGIVKVSEICICCQEVYNGVQERYAHPLFKGFCCSDCYERVKDFMFEIGDDEVHIYCSICATTGEMFICDERKCFRVFCHDCIEQFWNKKKIIEIQRQSPWLCFLCSSDSSSKYLKINKNWEENVFSLYLTSTFSKTEISIPKRRKKLRVLSVGDGISAGLVALEELGLDLVHYYALEGNSKAVRISLKHHSSKPYYTNLGCFDDFNFSSLEEKCPIDLLIGGFYNDISLKKEQKETEIDMNNLRSVCRFLEFYKIWEQLQQIRAGHPLFWIFVSDADMCPETRKRVNRFFECDPVVLNMRKYSAYFHPKLAWSNIPGFVSDWSDFKLKLFRELKITENCATPIVKDAKWISRIETIFGFKKQYTNISKTNILQQQKLVGRSGSVIMMKKIFQPLCEFFALRNK